MSHEIISQLKRKQKVIKSAITLEKVSAIAVNRHLAATKLKLNTVEKELAELKEQQSKIHFTAEKLASHSQVHIELLSAALQSIQVGTANQKSKEASLFTIKKQHKTAVQAAVKVELKQRVFNNKCDGILSAISTERDKLQDAEISELYNQRSNG
ncbi:MAG: hypothetical protein HRT37_07895 [Alteromonadaceae bacterium]|nr:hypothetical protein [Alteromonadaceae bacterium]